MLTSYYSYTLKLKFNANSYLTANIYTFHYSYIASMTVAIYATCV